MTNLQKFGLFILIAATLGVIKVFYFPEVNILPNMINKEQKEDSEINNHQKEAEDASSQEVQKEEEEKMPKIFVNVYFIGQNKNNQEVYKIVRRNYNPDTDGSKLEFAIKNLIKGPSVSERKNKIYSEIPKGTQLLYIKETPNKAIINLSSEFEQGGGTDGLYKRLYQLIKTANRNTNKDVYLRINDVQVEVIGGDGIMITQPLNNNSLGE